MPRILLYVFLILILAGMLGFSYQKEIYTAYLKYSNLISSEELEKINQKKVFINFPNKSHQYSLNELGISFKNNKERQIDQQQFDLFKLKLEEELQYLTLNPNINLEKNEFYILGEGSKIFLDEEKLFSMIEFNNLLDKNEIRISPKFKEAFALKKNMDANQNLIEKMTKNSLTIKIGRQIFTLDSKKLQNFLTKYQDENQKEIIKIDKNKIEEYLINLKQIQKLPAEFNLNEASQKLTTHLLFRLTEDIHAKTLVLPITSSHTLSPDLHQKFIEVNKSNQRAYLFENGKLIRELVISTGITWETPTGNFKVLNKVPMTISYSYIWYMPWYLPIGTINGSYYFGFHEIPYQVSYNGMIYSRDPETIGSPATGGCIQLLKGQAKEVFDWAEVGMPVYITENK